MGILSASVSITRYKVTGKLEEPVLQTIADGLRRNMITDIDNEASEKAVGWTSFEYPFNPNFEGSSFVMGAYLIFSLRIDKKAIPPKIVKKHHTIEMAKHLAETGRDRLSKNEKRAIREKVVNDLCLRIPATPAVCDLIWHMEDASLWFFSNQKAANEELETLFSNSFQVNLVRLFPYAVADLMLNLSESDRQILSNLSPARFTE